MKNFIAALAIVGVLMAGCDSGGTKPADTKKPADTPKKEEPKK